MLRYQTFGQRIIAAVVDGLVFLPVMVFSIWREMADLGDWVYYVSILVQTPIGIAYNVFLHWRFGQTIGKMFAKVKVVDVHERPVSFWQAFLRDIVYLADGMANLLIMAILFTVGHSHTSELYLSIQQYMILPLFGWIVIDTLVCIKSKKNRALHDLIAGTVVVRTDVPVDTEDGLNYYPPAPDAYDALRVDRS